MFTELQAYYLETVFNDTIFVLYITSLVVDMVTGNIAALTHRKWNSRTGINGTLRHLALGSVMFLLLPIITFTTNLPVIGNGIMLYVIAQYTISILENLSAMGINIKEPFTKYFEFLGKGTEEMKQENKNKNKKG